MSLFKFKAYPNCCGINMYHEPIDKEPLSWSPEEAQTRVNSLVNESTSKAAIFIVLTNDQDAVVGPALLNYKSTHTPGPHLLGHWQTDEKHFYVFHTNPWKGYKDGNKVTGYNATPFLSYWWGPKIPQNFYNSKENYKNIHTLTGFAYLPVQISYSEWLKNTYEPTIRNFKERGSAYALYMRDTKEQNITNYWGAQYATEEAYNKHFIEPIQKYLDPIEAAENSGLAFAALNDTQMSHQLFLLERGWKQVFYRVGNPNHDNTTYISMYVFSRETSDVEVPKAPVEVPPVPVKRATSKTKASVVKPAVRRTPPAVKVRRAKVLSPSSS